MPTLLRLGWILAALALAGCPGVNRLNHLVITDTTERTWTPVDPSSVPSLEPTPAPAPRARE